MTFHDFDESTWRTFAGKDATLREKIHMSTYGLAGEIGEYIDSLKKSFFHNHEIEMRKVWLELGDILYYLSIAAQVWGTNLEHIAEMNKEKLTKRYPEGFSSDRSINREE